jgi:DNA-directed RNA polymerase subunit RPC12/RpoP
MVTITNCPNCGSKRMYRSRRRNLRERAAAMLGCVMRRCHECGRRYVTFGRSMVNMQNLQRFVRRIGLALAMAAAAIFLLGVILWFSRAQSAAASDAGSVAPVRQTGVEMRVGV